MPPFPPACSVSNFNTESLLSDTSCNKLMELIGSCGGVTIAAPVCRSSGLLTTLKGQTARGLRDRIDAEFLADMGEFCRVGACLLFRSSSRGGIAGGWTARD